MCVGRLVKLDDRTVAVDGGHLGGGVYPAAAQTLRNCMSRFPGFARQLESVMCNERSSVTL